MFTEFFGFHAHPFQMTPDARLFFASSGHSRAQAHLAYGIAQREGFIIITGEVGAGKTTLVERLCAGLNPSSFSVARISTTQVSGDDLLRLVARSFGAVAEGPKATVLHSVSEAIREGARQGRRYLLIIDEAQALPHPALEELRMLSNVTENGRALLQTILLGQPQLRRVLGSPDLDQLRQRVLASCHLSGLSHEETQAYVEHRLKAVGWTGRPSWEGNALDLVHQYTDGIPRRINRLCSRVLLDAALQQTDRILPETVQATAVELEEDLGAITEAPPAAAAPAVGAATVIEELRKRLEQLERQVQRRERVFKRLTAMFGEAEGGGAE